MYSIDMTSILNPSTGQSYNDKHILQIPQGIQEVFNLLKVQLSFIL